MMGNLFPQSPRRTIGVLGLCLAVGLIASSRAGADTQYGTLRLNWKGAHATNWKIISPKGEGFGVTLSFNPTATFNEGAKARMVAGSYVAKATGGADRIFDEIAVTVRNGEETTITPAVAHITLAVKPAASENRKWHVYKGGTEIIICEWSLCAVPVGEERKLGYDVAPGSYKVTLTGNGKELSSESFYLATSDNYDCKSPK